MKPGLLFFLLLPAVFGHEWTGTRYNRFTSSVFREGKPFDFEDLKPIKNPNPYPEPRQQTLRPEFALYVPKKEKIYIALAGTLTHPKQEISVLDAKSLKEIKRIKVGLRPIHLSLHPSGKFLLITQEFSNYISIIHTDSDQLIGKIPADFYCQSTLISKDGKTAYAANLYLSQILKFELEELEDHLTGRLKPRPGFSRKTFESGNPSVHSILRQRCQKCHFESTGDYQVGEDSQKSFLSALAHANPGEPAKSRLIRAITSVKDGGYANARTGREFHAGGVIFEENDSDLKIIQNWIRQATDGPGYPVGNPHSMPRRMVFANEEKFLITNLTGTNDLAVLDLETEEDLGGIFLQGLTHNLIELKNPQNQEKSLLVLGLGAGFGAPRSRDPLGAETTDARHEAAQFTVLRDPKTTDTYPISKQHVMGPFDAVDGTWNFKMRDIQNDLIWISLQELRRPAVLKTPRPYLLKANRYEDHQNWVRYTSDTAEAMQGDIKADYPPELQRVHGSFPDSALQMGDFVYVSMKSSFEVVEYRIHWEPLEAYERLEPLRVFATGLFPTALTPLPKNRLLVVNSMADSLSILDLESGKSEEIHPFGKPEEVLQSDAAKGDLIFHSSKFSSDGDTSCFHCHYRDSGDGRPWGAAEAIAMDKTGHFYSGGTLGIPQVRNLFGNEPFYFEGTHLFAEGQGADINEPASSIDFVKPVVGGDYTGITSPLPKDQRPVMHEELKERVTVHSLGSSWWDLEERRNTFLKDRAREIFGKEYGLKDLYRFMGTFMSNDTYLPPNPYDRFQTTFQKGRDLFLSAEVMCAVCHSPPNFTSKSTLLAPNDRRALPQLTTVTRRDASYTLASVHAVERANSRPTDMGPEDPGRVEDIEGSFTTMQLRGIFDRPPVFLHHGRAKNLREVLLTPGHAATKTYPYEVHLGLENVRPDGREKAFNETQLRTPKGLLDPVTQTVDTHGGTSHLTPREIEDLLNFMLGIP